MNRRIRGRTFGGVGSRGLGAPSYPIGIGRALARPKQQSVSVENTNASFMEGGLYLVSLARHMPDRVSLGSASRSSWPALLCVNSDYHFFLRPNP